MGNILGSAARRPPSADAAALRAAARAAAEQRGAAFERSRAAYAAGDHAGAKAWSERGKAHGADVARLNAQAADLIFKANNAGRREGEVDLHGLHVTEAIAAAEAAVAATRARGARSLVLIVGRGLHSASGEARLKPAVLDDLITKHSLRVTPGTPNEGCLLVELVTPAEAGWVRRLVGAALDGGCVIC